MYTILTSRPVLVFAPPFRPFVAYSDISGAAILTPVATVFGSVAVLTKRHGSRLISDSWETHGSKNLDQLLDAKHEKHIPGIMILINLQRCFDVDYTRRQCAIRQIKINTRYKYRGPRA